MGWTFPASSAGSDFNYDFNASFTETQQREGPEYNFRRDDPAMKLATAAAPPPEFVSWAATTGTDPSTYLREREGMSAFVLQDGVVYHSYSSYSRGTDAIWGMYAWLDRAPKGRNERHVAPPRRVRPAMKRLADSLCLAAAPVFAAMAALAPGTAIRPCGCCAGRCLAGRRHGLDVRIDERIPCRAVAQAARGPAGLDPAGHAEVRALSPHQGNPGKGEFLYASKK